MTDVKNTTENKVVVGVDGSKSSLLALEWAAKYAENAAYCLEHKINVGETM